MPNLFDSPRDFDYLRNARYWERVSRKTGAEPDQIAAQNSHLPAEVHRYYRRRQVSFLSSVLARLQEPRHVLDLGCGPGVWALELADGVDSWLGFDIAPAFVEHARREAASRNLSHLRFETRSLLSVEEGPRFNLVLLSGTLGYVSDRDLVPVLRTAREHLLPGGLVYVRVSTVPGPYPRMARRGAYQILYRRQEEYLNAFRDAGLKAEVVRDVAHSESILASVYVVLGRALGLSGPTCCRAAAWMPALTFELARRVMDCTPVPQSHHYVLSQD